jgi:hypothetical protein
MVCAIAFVGRDKGWRSLVPRCEMVLHDHQQFADLAIRALVQVFVQ